MSECRTLAAILAEGATYRALGDRLGLTPDAARMRARRAGLRAVHRYRQPDPATARRIYVARQMLAQGCDWSDLEERLGMSAAAARAMLRRAGPPQPMT